jgi:hypothetical protein
VHCSERYHAIERTPPNERLVEAPLKRFRVRGPGSPYRITPVAQRAVQQTGTQNELLLLLVVTTPAAVTVRLVNPVANRLVIWRGHRWRSLGGRRGPARSRLVTARFRIDAGFPFSAVDGPAFAIADADSLRAIY